MLISIVCAQCGADSSLELSDLLNDPGLFVCENCGAKANPDIVELFAGSLDEALANLNRLCRKFHVEFCVDTDDLNDEKSDLCDETDDESVMWSNTIEPDEDNE